MGEQGSEHLGAPLGQRPAAHRLESPGGEVREAEVVDGQGHSEVDVAIPLVGRPGLVAQVRSAERQHLSPGVAQPPSHGLRDHRQLAGVADHDPPALHAAGLEPQALVLAYLRDGDLGRGPPREPLEGLDGGSPHHAVVGQADVLLELPDRGLRPRPQDPIDPVRVEAELAEAALHLGHIIAAHHRGPVVEEPVPEPVVGLDESVPRLRPADAVHHQAAVVLELAERRLGGRAELLMVDTGAVTDQRQPLLEVADSLADVAAPQRQNPAGTGAGHSAIRGARQVRSAEPPSAWLPPPAWPVLRP